MTFDGNILLWIQDYIRTDWMTPFWVLLSKLGNGGMIWIASIIVLLIPKKTRKIALLAALSLLLGWSCNELIKHLVARTRPYDAITTLTPLVAKLDSYSFPSGHTCASFSVAVVYYRMFSKKVGWIALLLAILIGLSRLYVGVHYPTDVLGGCVVGCVWSYIVLQVYYRKTQQ